MGICKSKLINYKISVCKQVVNENDLNKNIFECEKCDDLLLYGDIDNFHCDKCNLCINGKKQKYKHCDKCGFCIDKQYYKKHLCITNDANSECCICFENMKNREDVLLFKCGHMLHDKCVNKLIDYDIVVCPFCKRAFIDVRNDFI